MLAMSTSESKAVAVATPAPSDSASAAANGGSKGKKESEASKRARRRQAQKQNKKLLRELDAQQAAKFAALKEEEEKSKEEAEKKVAEEDEQKQAVDSSADANGVAAMDLSAENMTVTVKSEGGSNAAAKSEEVIVEDASIDLSNPALAEFADIFARFKKRSEYAAGVAAEEEEKLEDSHVDPAEKSKEERIDEELRHLAGEGVEDQQLSRRKLKEQNRYAISQLKQLVAKPEVVELHDVNSAHPRLLVYLKSYRNTVPVPQHWSQKRKYLQNKRGYEKPPFKLPENIEQTGITKMRGADADKGKEPLKNKQLQREKMRPKTGKIDIDYQILHDAFFRYQTKPPMTQHGELYYEGREHEIKMTEKRPCVYSPALREALGMTEETSPPPWLIVMQRIGPPPAYPNLKIPAVSAPIPAGARYGFGEGEWGKPPVDPMGRPLYGDVFGVEKKPVESEKIDLTPWGKLESEAEEEEEEEEEEMAEEEQKETMEEEGSVSGTASTLSTVSGLSTPEMLNLRKDGTGTETPDTVRRAPPALYQVLEEKKAHVGNAMFGTAHTYVLPDATSGTAAAAAVSVTDQERRVDAARAKARAQVEVALTPEELEGLDAASLKRKYEQRLLEEQEISKKGVTAAADDEEEEGRATKKRKKGGSEKSKAFKDFKF